MARENRTLGEERQASRFRPSIGYHSGVGSGRRMLERACAELAG